MPLKWYSSMKKNYKYSFNFWHRKLNMNVRNCYLSSAGKEIWKGLKMCRRYFHSGNGFRKSAKKFINSLKLAKSLLSFLNKLCNDDYRTGPKPNIALEVFFKGVFARSIRLDAFVFCYFFFVFWGAFFLIFFFSLLFRWCNMPGMVTPNMPGVKMKSDQCPCGVTLLPFLDKLLWVLPLWIRWTHCTSWEWWMSMKKPENGSSRSWISTKW